MASCHGGFPELFRAGDFLCACACAQDSNAETQLRFLREARTDFGRYILLKSLRVSSFSFPALSNLPKRILIPIIFFSRASRISFPILAHSNLFQVISLPFFLRQRTPKTRVNLVKAREHSRLEEEVCAENRNPAGGHTSRRDKA